MNTSVTRRRFFGSLGAACVAGAGGDVIAASDRVTTEQQRQDGTAQSGEEFADDTVERLLSEHDVDGASVSLVTGPGETVTRGYGHAYRSPDVPIDPAETLVEIGSISKVLTWTALMQLVDRGRVAVDDAVAEHVTSVRVPQRHGRVKLWHLPTHTPGFEARVRGDKVSDPENVRPLVESVRRPKPAQVRSPGDMVVYTNYAAALAGQLIADRTGMSFSEYVDTNVFEPLGMTRSTFGTAPPGLVPGAPERTDDLSWYSDVPPASGMASTAADMGKFLHAHLHPDEARDPIMSPSAFEDMHREWFSPHERIRGMAFGLAENSHGDTRLLEHGGAMPRFSSKLVFAPEQGIGLFVSVHGQESAAAITALEDAFLDRFAGSATDAEPPGDRPQVEADTLPAGTFRSVYATDSTTYDKTLWAATTSSIDLTAGPDGTLRTQMGDAEHEWVRIGPDLYRRADGGDTLLLQRADDGTQHLILESRMPLPYERVSWAGQYDIQIAVAAVAMLISLLSVLRLVARSVWIGGTIDSDRMWLARPSVIEGVAAGWPFVFALAVVTILVVGSGVTGISIGDRAPPGLQIAFLIPLLGAVGTAVAAVTSARAWRRSLWSLTDRLRYSVVVASSVALLWLCDYWNLVGIAV